MSGIERWSGGDHVVLRQVGLDNGWVVGWPQIVVEDSPERIVLFQPAGAVAENVPGVGDDVRSRLMPESNRNWPPQYSFPLALLRIIPTLAEHAVEIHFSDVLPTPMPHARWLDEHGYYRGIKVNLQARFRRTSIGFDTTDNALDIVMGTDLDWRWKDEDDVTARVAVGLTYPEEAAAFRAEGERVIVDIERRAYPFDQPWEDWRPDPTWTPPQLPEGWADVEGANRDLNRERLD